MLSNGDGDAGQLTHLITLYLTITDAPIPEGQAKMSLTKRVLIALRRADEAKEPIDQKNKWKGAVRRIKWVMDTVSPIAEVRTILPLLDRADFRSQLHPFAKMAYGLVSAIPEVHLFASLSEGEHLYYVFSGARNS